MYHNGTIGAIFSPVGARLEQRPTAATWLTAFLVEQRGFQFPVQWQHSGPEILADQRPGNALDTGARFPTIVQQQAVAVNIVAAVMCKSLDGTKLLIGQMWY